VESLVRLSKAQNPGWIVAPRLVDAPVTPSRLATISILPTSSPTNSYSSTTSPSQAAPLYPQGTVDDTELPPVMPPLGSGPSQAPQPAPAARTGPGIPVIPVGGPGRGGGGGGTRVPQD